MLVLNILCHCLQHIVHCAVCHISKTSKSHEYHLLRHHIATEDDIQHFLKSNKKKKLMKILNNQYNKKVKKRIYK